MRIAWILPILLLTVGCADDSVGSGGGSAAAATGGSTGSTSSATATASSGSTGSGGGDSVWRPPTGTTWQWQLAGLPVDTSLDVAAYDIDLFESPDSLFQELRSAGRVVICYFSAGSWESYRPDAAAFSAAVKGSPLDPPFADELWLDIRSSEVRTLMQARLDLAQNRGCDAVEPDNVDGFDNANGFQLTATDQLDFNRFIASEAHARGLSVGLKNNVAQLTELEPDFDWALNEECYSYDECDAYSSNFVAAGKAVFHAEYVPAAQLGSVCSVTKPLGLSTLIKNIELDAFAIACP